MEINKSLKEFLDIWNEILEFEQHTLPLCAAENTTSDFVNIPRGTFLQDKYILGGTMKYTKENNFFGSELLFKLYELINKQCTKLFKSKIPFSIPMRM
jgi:glycine hydroxymethyltransferase